MLRVKNKFERMIFIIKFYLMLWQTLGFFELLFQVSPYVKWGRFFQKFHVTSV